VYNAVTKTPAVTANDANPLPGRPLCATASMMLSFE